MRGARHAVLALAAVAAALVLAGGLAVAATFEGTNNDDAISGTDADDTMRG